MKTLIINAKFGTFENQQGEEVNYANVHLLHHEKFNENSKKGQDVIKCKTTPSLVRELGELPGYYECEFLPMKNGMELISAIPAKS